MALLKDIAGMAAAGLASKIFGKAQDSVGKGFLTGQTDPNLRNINYTIIIKQDQDVAGGGSKAPRIVVGTLPQSFNIAQSAEWKAPWGAGLGGSGEIGDILALTGNRLVAQVLTMKVWQGSADDFEFSVQFELRTWADPVKDVIEPLQTLLKMTMPSMTESGFLQSPGPILDKAAIEAVGGTLVNTATSVISGVTDAYEKAKKTKDGKTELSSAVKDAFSAASNTLSASGVAKKDWIETKLKNKISIQLGRWFRLNNVIITNVQHEIKAQTPEANTGMIQQASVTVSFKPMFALTAEDVSSMLRGGVGGGAGGGAPFASTTAI